MLHDIKCGQNNVQGIAQLGTELFVCMYHSERVAVYNLNTYSLTRHVTIPGMQHPRNLAACKQNNCLYISCYELKCIHRVDLSNSSCSKWSLSAEPRVVSLTRAFDLLVTLRRSIVEYATSGSLIRSFKLDVSIDNAQQAIELSNGQFVVCHPDSTQHRVCVVDTAGRIVHSYGGPKGSSAGQLNAPFRLAVDKRGCVLVADCDNKKVQVLSPTLTRLGDVTTPGHQLKQPCALHLDELSNRLYVGESCSPSRWFVLSCES